MKEFIFDEKKYAEDMIFDHKVDRSNINAYIFQLAKYNYFVENMDDDSNYHNIIDYLRKYCSMFAESDYCIKIEKIIKQVKKREYVKVDSIKIRQSELDFIKSLDNIRQEKLAFVLLCISKFNHEAYHTNDYWVNNYSIGTVGTLARVHVTKQEKLELYRELYLKHAFELSNKIGTFNQRILFVSEDENDPVVLELNEIDYKELAYTYLYYKNGFSGYARCEKCGRLIRKKANNQKYCKECSQIVEKEKCRQRVQKHREKM